MFFHGEGVPANNVQAYIVLKMAAVNGAEDALDTADEVAEHMQRDELELATQVLGQIFRNYLQELQSADGRSPFSRPALIDLWRGSKLSRRKRPTSQASASETA